MNWLVTGGCGFIGSNLVRHLLGQGGHGIRVIDNLTVGGRDDLRWGAPGFTEANGGPAGRLVPGSVELVEGDILDAELALEAAREIDVIVHLAANTGVQPSIDDPRKDCLTNVVGTLNYLEAARQRGVKRFVFASSGGTVIGDCEPPIHEEMVPHPKSPYGASKSACEGYLSAYHGTFGLETVALRFGNVYGPGSNHKNSVVARFVRRALSGEPLEIYGDGAQTRDFIFIGDLLEAIERAATTAGVGGNVFQIATSAETSIVELAELIRPLLKEHLGVAPSVHHAPALEGEIRRNYSDTGKAHERLGWQARTSLRDGLDQTLRWFAREPAPSRPG